MSSENLEIYRRTWTSDAPTSRNLRYQTESRRAGINMPLKYQTSQVRMLPGMSQLLIVMLLSKIRYEVVDTFCSSTAQLGRTSIYLAIKSVSRSLDEPHRISITLLIDLTIIMTST